MERLTEKDLQDLLGFLRDIYAFHTLDGFVSHLLADLPRVIRSAPITTYVEMNPSKGTSINWVDQHVPADADRAFAMFMHEHPVLQYYQKTGDGRAHKVSDFLTQIQFHRLSLYNECYRPIGHIEDVLGTILPGPGGLLVGIALTRERRDFTERDRSVLDLLRPHLIQAHRNAIAVTQTQLDFAFVKHILEALDEGVIVLTPNARIRMMTPRSRQLLVEYFGPRLRQESLLPESLCTWLKHQEGELGRIETGPPPPCRPLVVEREGKRLLVRLINDIDQRILLLKEVESPNLWSQPIKYPGLTSRECEILSWVARGKTNVEIALILRISPRTVAKHLEHIYEKLGVTTRTAAATSVLESLASTSHTERKRSLPSL